MRIVRIKATLIRPIVDKTRIFRRNGGWIMILSFLKSARKSRIAARNLRILSALDDEMLSDIGLDRRTLRTFCENGCAHVPPPPSQAETPRALMIPGGLGIAFR
ncbi:protein of unknown function [Methylobacterium sp. 275MFSha3.1]|nr:protein of unknown function [Methylobacterium sp. 275MFSha3.1]